MTPRPQMLRSPERTAELREDFETLDEDQDGRLQLDEFVAFLDGMEAGMSPEESRIGFQEIDTDRDGSIGLDEFVAWWDER